MGTQCPDHPRNWHKQEKRGNRHERGYGSAWERVRKLVMLRDKGLCKPCGFQNRVSPATEVDHIVPKSQGGTDDQVNLQSICSACHKMKTALESTGERASFQPEWLPEPKIPTLLIFGPPGSGKTTYAREIAQGAPSQALPAGWLVGDAGSSHRTLIIDLDEIASKQSGLPIHHAGKDDRVNAVRARNHLIASLASPSCGWDRAIITMTGSGPEIRKWWTDKLKAQAVVMQTPKDVCIYRVHGRDLPIVRRLEQVRLVEAWR